MKKIDWEKVPVNTLVYVWDKDTRPEFPTVKYFERFKFPDSHPFKCRSGSGIPLDGFKHANLVLPADIEKYTVEEHEYRPCRTLEEFRPFFGKLAKEKDRQIFKEINAVAFEGVDYTADNWFNIYELVEPINGSTIIGVREE